MREEAGLATQAGGRGLLSSGAEPIALGRGLLLAGAGLIPTLRGRWSFLGWAGFAPTGDFREGDRHPGGWGHPGGALGSQDTCPLRHNVVAEGLWGDCGSTLGSGTPPLKAQPGDDEGLGCLWPHSGIRRHSFEGTLVAERGCGVALVALGVSRPIPYSRVG